MSYTVLALKWRPRRFDQLVGQPHVVQALVNSLTENRLHHAYLFSGTRGVGKTTVARLLAKALNCETGVVPEPCGVCAACVAIDQGRFVDLIEVDAASRTRVDDTRELLDNVQYSPTRGRFKVYLIDEVHMLSNHSFNALLKTLEEPPPHVKFLLATTDPQKLPVTVLSRCLQFNLKKLTAAQIQAQLEKICAAETIPAEADGLKAIARAAEGSMRDALSLLDQGVAFGGGTIEAAAINSMLGSIDRAHVLRMLDALAQQDGARLLAEVDQLDELAPDYGAVLDELLGALQHLAVLQLVQGRTDEEELALLAPLAAQMSAEDVQLYYQIALQGRRDLPVCRDPRMGFEMTLLRMLAFRPAGADEAPRVRPAAAAQPSGAPASRPASSEPKAAPSRARAGESAVAPSQPRGGESNVAPSQPRSSESAFVQGNPRSAAPGAVPSAFPSREPAPNIAPAQPAAGRVVAASPERSAPAAQASAPNVDWHELLRALDVRGPARQLADHCELVAAAGSWQFLLPPDKAHLNTPQVRSRLEAALGEHLGRAVRVMISSGQPSRPTPAEVRKANENERMREARESIENDPNVKAVQAAFDAVLEPDSIRSTQ